MRVFVFGFVAYYGTFCNNFVVIVTMQMIKLVSIPLERYILRPTCAYVR